jgi:hypothetical protein
VQKKKKGAKIDNKEGAHPSDLSLAADGLWTRA